MLLNVILTWVESVQPNENVRFRFTAYWWTMKKNNMQYINLFIRLILTNLERFLITCLITSMVCILLFRLILQHDFVLGTSNKGSLNSLKVPFRQLVLNYVRDKLQNTLLRNLWSYKLFKLLISKRKLSRNWPTCCNWSC